MTGGDAGVVSIPVVVMASIFFVATMNTVTEAHFGPRDTLKFFVLGDWGGSSAHECVDTGCPTKNQIADAQGMASFARELGDIDFVVGVGDNFYPNGIKKGGALSPQFKHNFEEVYKDKELQCPWYQLGGNHDHGDGKVYANISAQLAYHHLSPRWNFPYYWYTYSWSFKAKSGKIVSQSVLHYS